MLAFPQWSPQVGEGCRAAHWTPPARFAHYVARALPHPLPLHPPVPQISDEESSGGSSPERISADASEDATVCEWRGCGARCAGVARLSAHVARTHAHPHRDGLFYCAWKACARPQRGFNARYKMLVHVRTHTNERPHTCNQCHKSFSRAENLKIHLRSHSGEKPYVCPYEGCGKAYSNSSDRFKHTRTHTVDKPYCCKVPGCNKRYTDPSSLRKHVKTYKHFTPKDLPAHDRGSSDEALSPAMSPEYTTEPTYHSTRTSPLLLPHIAYRSPVSPTYAEMPRIPQPVYASMDKLYLSPQHIYRIPSYEMSYLEHKQMYEHACRSYYSPALSYPVLSPDLNDKAYVREVEPTLVDMPRIRPVETEEAPLNLKCARIECRPIEDLVRRTDLPLDLSTKS